MPKTEGELSDIFSFSPDYLINTSKDNTQPFKSMEALNRLQSRMSYLNSPIDQRQNLDYIWSDLPSIDEDEDASKLRNNIDGNMPISRVLSQTYSYSSDSSNSPNGLPRYSPTQVNNRHNGVFNCGNSTDSGRLSSSSSRQSFSFSSDSGSMRGRNSITSPIDPGSPTLDDVILMGARPKSPFSRCSVGSTPYSKESFDSLSDFMNSFSLSSPGPNNSASRASPTSPTNTHQQCLSPNNSAMTSSYSDLNKNLSASNCNNPSQSAVDISALQQQLQSAYLASQLLPNLVDAPNLLGILGEINKQNSPANDPYAIEKAAKVHRSAAAVCEANCTWSGQLPVRIHKNPFYSCKVFLGGVPWDVTELALKQAFMQFGNIQVEWPGKDNSANPPKGFVYILFENEKQVKALLANCSQVFTSDNYYFKISSRRIRQKEVQVIPWVLSDSNYVRSPSFQLDPAKTVFVGALHGMLSAEGLANIMNDLFGGVVYAGIDTDKHKYPIGSGRVTFNNNGAYRKAVKAAFIEIKAPKFTKKVQVDPYLADSVCQVCNLQQGPYFCRDDTCFKYFCRTCWQAVHPLDLKNHMPLMRNSRLRTQNINRMI